MAITEVKALDFEQSLAPLAKQLTTLEKQAAKEPSPSAQENVEEARLALLERLDALYAELTPWQTVQVARHPERPHADDLVSAICSEFVEFAGDRLYADDPAIMGGLARLDDRVVMVLGHRKGHDTRENVTRNYGMPHPEGYRKARRLMLQAEKFGVPLVCLLDTPAAQASLPAEERGQAWALGDNLTTLATLPVPIVVAVIGEGGSGGALAIGVGDRLLMFEHAIYSVASPEACASIVWKDAKYAPEAAAALKLTARDLHRLGVADRVLKEPIGGAHRDPDATATTLKGALRAELDDLCPLPTTDLLAARYHRLRHFGPFLEASVGDQSVNGAVRPS